MSTYFLLDPFEFPYYFYCILGELIYVLSIVACIPSTFCPTLGHHHTPSSQQTYIKLFYRNQMHYNYKSDEKILKTLIHKNILPTDPNKKIKLVIYYNKFKTSNLVIRNNSSPSIGVLQKTNVIYKFKCPLTPDDGPKSGRKY